MQPRIDWDSEDTKELLYAILFCTYILEIVTPSLNWDNIVDFLLFEV